MTKRNPFRGDMGNESANRGVFNVEYLTLVWKHSVKNLIVIFLDELMNDLIQWLILSYMFFVVKIDNV